MVLAIIVSSNINAHAADDNYNIPAEAAVYEGHSYMRYDESMTWQEADEYCRSLGGHLVSIDSDEGEQNFVRDLISQGSRNAYWNSLVRVDSGILIKKHKWEWQHGDTATALFEELLATIFDSNGKDEEKETSLFEKLLTNILDSNGEYGELTFWAEGEPNNDGENGAQENRCVMLARDEGTGKAGEWIDLNENGNPDGYYSKENLGFVCEWDKAPLTDGPGPATLEFEQSEYHLSPGETAECPVVYNNLPEVTLEANYDDSIIDILQAEEGVITIKALSAGSTALKVIAHAENYEITAECQIYVEDSDPVQDGPILSRDAIYQAAETFNLDLEKPSFQALQLINTKYGDELSGHTDTPIVAVFEGIGNSASTKEHRNALCIVVKDGQVVYMNWNSTTIPDNPFSPRNNGVGATDIPTLISGIYDYVSTNHYSKKYGSYAALNVQNANVLRHESRTSFFPSTSRFINVHRRMQDELTDPSDTWGNSTGCINVGRAGTGKDSEYSAFVTAVGIVDPGWSDYRVYDHKVQGKIVVDRSWARDYLSNIGYTEEAIDIIVNEDTSEERDQIQGQENHQEAAQIADEGEEAEGQGISGVPGYTILDQLYQSIHSEAKKIISNLTGADG